MSKLGLCLLGLFLSGCTPSYFPDKDTVEWKLMYSHDLLHRSNGFQMDQLDRIEGQLDTISKQLKELKTNE